MMGRLSPEVALGKYAEGRTGWHASELPDIAVDLYDSPCETKMPSCGLQVLLSGLLTKTKTCKVDG